jgi:hypothetical protein
MSCHQHVTMLLSSEKCLTMLKKCFESKQLFLYLIFLQNKLEKENTSTEEVKCIIDTLLV